MNVWSMKTKNYIWHALTTSVKACFSVVAIITLGACSEDDKERVNSITDPEGLNISLTWSVGSTNDVALESADLDLKLFLDQDELKSSARPDEFEGFDYTFPDGDGQYGIKVIYFGAYTTQQVTYTLSITGKSIERTFSVKGTFLPADQGASISAVTIRKEADKYIFTTAQIQ